MTLPKKVLIIRMLRAFGFGEAESNFNMLKETGVLRIVLLLLRMPEDTLFKNIKGTILTEIDELIDGDHTSLFQIFKAWDTQYDDTIKNHIDDHAIIAMLIPLTYKDINASNIDEIIQSVSSDYIYSRHRNDKITISPDEIKRHLETLFGKNISSSSSILIPKEKSDEVAAAPSAALAAHEEVPSPPCGMVVAPNAPEIARKKTERKIRKAEKRIKNAAEQMKAAEEARINAATEKAEQIRVAKEAKRKAAAEAEQTRIAQEERIKAEKIKLEEASSQIAAAPSQQKKKVIKKQISAAAPAPKIDPHKEFKLRNGIETFEVFKEGNSQCAEWVKQKNLSELILRSRIELSSFNTIYKIKFNDGSRFEGILIYEEIFDTMEERFIGLLDDTLFEGFHKKNSDGFYFDGRLYYKEKEKINDQIFYNFFFPGKPTGLESLKNKKSIQQFKLDTMKFNGIFRPHQNSFYYKNGEFSFSDERNFVCFDNSLKKGQEKMKSMEASFAAAEQAKELNENTKLCHIISSENDVSINEFLKKISISLLAGKVLISHFVKKDGRIYFNIKIVMEKNKLFTCVFHFSLDEENKNKSIIDVIKEIMFNRTTNFQDAQPYVLNNGSIFKFGEFILDKGELIVNENWKLCFEDGSYNRSLRIKTLKVVGDNSYEIIFNDNSEFKGKVVKNIFHGVLNGCQFRGTRTIDSETNTCYFNGQIQLNPDDIARFGIQDFITEKPVTFSGIFGFTDPGNKFILQEGRFIK